MIAVTTFHILMNTVSKQVPSVDLEKLGLPPLWQGQHDWTDYVISSDAEWQSTLFLLTDCLELKQNDQIDRYVTRLWSLNLVFKPQY